MKKLILSGVAMMVSAASIAQTVNMDLTPVKTAAGKVAVEAVQLCCFLFIIIGVFGAAYEYHKDNSAAVKGIIMAIVLAVIILAVTYVGKSTFLV